MSGLKAQPTVTDTGTPKSYRCKAPHTITALTVDRVVRRGLDGAPRDPVLEALGRDVRLHLVCLGPPPPIHEPILLEANVLHLLLTQVCSSKSRRSVHARAPRPSQRVSLWCQRQGQEVSPLRSAGARAREVCTQPPNLRSPWPSQNVSLWWQG